jgi:tRNA threonylcarbamoyladenosine biosynthesis protein TsaE
MIWQTSSTGSADTERLGESLGKLLKGGEVIELRSDLGGGKTTFVKGLARGAGSRDNVASPTFTLNRQYRAKGLLINHFDFYRLDEPGIMADQLAESFDDNNVTVVEWGDKVGDVLPEERLSIDIEPVAAAPDERRLTLRYPLSMQGLITHLETEWQVSRP